MTDENGQVIPPVSGIMSGEIPPTAAITQTLSLGAAGNLQLTSAGKWLFALGIIALAVWYLRR